MNTRLRSNIIRGMPGGPIINNDFCSCARAADRFLIF